MWRSFFPRIARLVRFYQAAAVNTLFGFGVYALLISLGVQLYAAQAIAQILGMTFNYFTYSRHVFHDRAGSKHRFVLAYASNYLVNLGLLAIFDRVTTNDYLAGLMATIVASVINFVALKTLVFKWARSAD